MLRHEKSPLFNIGCFTTAWVFFEQLRSACATLNIELALIHGDATPTESVRQDTGELAWATKVRNRHWRVGGRDLLWQPISGGVVQQADLVVLMQESRIFV